MAGAPMAEDASIQLLSDGGLAVLNEPFKVFLTFEVSCQVFISSLGCQLLCSEALTVFLG